jgi:L-seryl-tRNA(Ser) seleniumtransferase
MSKATVEPSDSATSGAGALRGLPSVEKLLAANELRPLIAAFGRARVKQAAVTHLASLRTVRQPWDEQLAHAAIRTSLETLVASSLRRVINGTGVIIHTNLGRCPIAPELWATAAAVTTSYTNLEFDLIEGQRGARDEHLASLCRELFGCEAAILTNNNAAATLLLLAATSAGREVIVSRGELVEIGGSFRVPDVIQQGGARLREVGTTNRTRASDYDRAVTGETAAMLRVHRSNFEIVGFTETPQIAELLAVARQRNVPLLYDEGSGRVVDLQRYGFARAETIRELIASGVDAVTCSTDKLIGATQGGLILGSKAIIDHCRKHPLMRALRAGKESYAIIAETLRAFVTDQYEERIPIYRMLATSAEALRERGARLIAGVAAELVESRAALGGGTTPTETMSSVAIAIDGSANALHARFLAMPIPIVGRIVDDRFLVDLRTVQPDDDESLREALRTR